MGSSDWRATVAMLAVGLAGPPACLTKDNPNYSGSGETNAASSGPDETSSSTSTTSGGPSTSGATSPTTGTSSDAATTGPEPVRCDEQPDRVCFGVPVTYGTNSSIADGDLATSDIDGDGDQDVIVALERQDEVQLFLGDGQGDLQEQTQTWDTASRPRTLSIADLDDDGLLDIVTSVTTDQSNSFSGVTILYGTGPAEFESHLDIELGGNINAATVGQFGGDASLDIVVADRDEGELIVLVQDRGAFVEGAPFSFGGGANRMAAGDLDAMGRQEVVVADNSLDSGLGIVSFDAAGQIMAVAEAGLDRAPHFGAVLVDLDDDGDLDAVTARATNPGQLLLFFNDAGQFSDADSIELPVMPEPRDVAAGDVNGDGFVDLVVAEHGTPDEEGHTLAVFVADAQGEFANVSIELQEDLRPRSLELADLNGDGLDDIVAGTTGDRLVLVRTELP